MKNKKIDELLDSILSQVEDKESLLDIQDQLFKRGVETLLTQVAATTSFNVKL